MKNFYVDSLRDGAVVDDVFIVTSKILGRTQDGSPFVRFKLSDCTGTVEAIKWDTSESAFASLAVDDFVYVRGAVGTYRERTQLVLESFRRYDQKVDPRDFLPKSPCDPDEMLASLKNIIASVKDPYLAQILEFFFSDEDFLVKFTTAPTAQKIHHAYIGGLLEHTLGVAQGGDAIAPLYKDLNRDLLITGAILHDIGKIEEFSWNKSIRYSDSGHLIGHIVLGCSMVEKAADKVKDMHPLTRLELMHMILSHHGEKEWGSPKRPKSLQAIVLHYLDDLDAKMSMCLQALSENGRGDSDIWTEKHWVLERPLFRSQPGTLAEESEDGFNGKGGNSQELPF